MVPVIDIRNRENNIKVDSIRWQPGHTGAILIAILIPSNNNNNPVEFLGNSRILELTGKVNE